MLRPLSTFLSWVNKQHTQNPIYPVSMDEIDAGSRLTLASVEKLRSLWRWRQRAWKEFGLHLRGISISQFHRGKARFPGLFQPLMAFWNFRVIQRASRQGTGSLKLSGNDWPVRKEAGRTHWGYGARKLPEVKQNMHSKDRQVNMIWILIGRSLFKEGMKGKL